MIEGKLPLDELEEMISKQTSHIQGIIQGPKIGCDVAVINYQEAIKYSQEFYNSKEEVLLVCKTDPITFPTPDPGRYAVIVNTNDVVTSGALPYGFNATIILPVGETKETAFQIQESIYRTCSELKVAILGGHTEFSSSVNTPIVSGAMLGFVPKDFYVSREIREGNVMICIGWCAKEGIGIIASEGLEKLQHYFSSKTLKDLITLGANISIMDIALEINKQIKPELMHDVTEGGVIGAAYETIISEGYGLELFSEKFPLTNDTLDVCKLLNINPLRVISSGTLLLITSEEKANKLKAKSTQKIPIEIVGCVTSKEEGIKLDGKNIDPPRGDAIIDALKKIKEWKLS